MASKNVPRPLQSGKPFGLTNGDNGPGDASSVPGLTKGGPRTPSTSGNTKSTPPSDGGTHPMVKGGPRVPSTRARKV